MGHYRTADVFLAPGLVSLTRIPLAIAFPLVVTQPGWAIVVLLAAGLSDIVDGWIARRFSLATPTGAVIDGATDKLFVATVAGTMVFRGYLDVWDVILLSTREIGELPLVLWWAFHRAQRQRRAEDPKANAAGKTATCLQFGAVGLAILNHAWLDATLWVTAATGSLAAVVYWRRELSANPSSRHR